jgi:hypothetical protein
MLANPHQGGEKAKGIRVAEWLVGLKARGRPTCLPMPVWIRG